MENIAGYLKQTKLFWGLSIETINECIVPNGSITEYEKDSFVISTHQKVDTIKVLLHGKINIVYYYADGSYSLASSEFPPRVLALDLIATKSQLAPYSAVAAEPSAIFSFPADIILKSGYLPEKDRQNILNQLLIMLSHLNLQKENHLMILSRNGLRDRIMIYLSMQAQWKKSLSFTIPFSREEMAAYLCVNRSTLSHELSLMRKEGIIDFSKNKFTILKYEHNEEGFGL